MRKLVRLAAWLYPSAWRRRYGAEFAALLDDAGPQWRDVFDVLSGAIKMQLSTWSLRNVTVACGMVGLIIAAGLGFSLPNVYVSRALLQMEAPDANDQFARLWQQVVSRQSLAEIIKRPSLNLYKDKRDHEPLEDVIERMKSRDLRIERVDGSGSFVVSFSYPDRFVAQATIGALITKLIDANQVAARRGDFRNASTISLIDPASLAETPAAPNRWQIAIMGLVLGVVVGMVAVGVRRASLPGGSPAAGPKA